jgi:hypothetical protein
MGIAAEYGWDDEVSIGSVFGSGLFFFTEKKSIDRDGLE